MNKIAVLLVLAMILVSSMMISACGGDEDKETSTPAQTQTSVTTPTATGKTLETPIQTSTPVATTTSTRTPAPTSLSGETLADIFGMDTDIGPVKYEQVISASGVADMNQSTKMWMKGAWTEKMKWRYETIQGGQTVVTLLDLDAKTFFMYFPDQNMAYTLDMSQAQQSPIEGYEDIQPMYVGSETIDGKTCSIYEWTQEEGQYKYWIWDTHKLPIRTEMIVSDQTTVIEYKNFDFGDISDSMFKLPDGVTIKDMADFGKGMEDLFK